MGRERQTARVRSFRDLVAWQKAVELVVYAYQQTANLPLEERFELSSQIRRCAVRIPSCIAEGWGRHSVRDYVRFLRIAQGSSYELTTQVEISDRIGFKGDWPGLTVRSEEVSRLIGGLISSLLPSA